MSVEDLSKHARARFLLQRLKESLEQIVIKDPTGDFSLWDTYGKTLAAIEHHVTTLEQYRMREALFDASSKPVEVSLEDFFRNRYREVGGYIYTALPPGIEVDAEWFKWGKVAETTLGTLACQFDADDSPAETAPSA